MSNLGARVDALIHARKLDEAADLGKRALLEEPGNPDHECRMAIIRLQQQLPDRCLKHARRAIEIDPTKEWAHRLRAKAYIVKGWHHDAVLAAKVAVGARPDEPMAHETLADAYFMVGDLDAAGDAIDVAVSLGPERVTALKRRARIHLLQGDLDIAEKVATQGLACDPEHAALQIILGQIAEQHGDIDSAAEFYVAAGRTDPRDEQAIGGLRRLVRYGAGAAGFGLAASFAGRKGIQSGLSSADEYDLTSTPLDWVILIVLTAAVAGAALYPTMKWLFPWMLRLLEPLNRRAALKRAKRLPPAARSILEADLSGKR